MLKCLALQSRSWLLYIMLIGLASLTRCPMSCTAVGTSPMSPVGTWQGVASSARGRSHRRAHLSKWTVRSRNTLCPTRGLIRELTTIVAGCCILEVRRPWTRLHNVRNRRRETVTVRGWSPLALAPFPMRTRLAWHMPKGSLFHQT